MNHEEISYKQWDSCAKRAQNAELKKSGRATSFASISNLVGAQKFILEIISDRKRMIVRKGWREAMKQAAISEKISRSSDE